MTGILAGAAAAPVRSASRARALHPFLQCPGCGVVHRSVPRADPAPSGVPTLAGILVLFIALGRGRRGVAALDRCRYRRRGELCRLVRHLVVGVPEAWVSGTSGCPGSSAWPPAGSACSTSTSPSPGFILGLMIGIAPGGLQGTGRRTRIPFAPALAAGAIVAVLWGIPIAGHPPSTGLSVPLPVHGGDVAPSAVSRRAAQVGLHAEGSMAARVDLR